MKEYPQDIINKVDYLKIIQLRTDLKQKYTKLISEFSKIYDLIPNYKFKDNDFNNDNVSFGKNAKLSQQKLLDLENLLLKLSPWRKGPFSIDSIFLDAEWKSNLKWERIIKYCQLDLKNKLIADIGANNAYYMYRMLGLKAKMVIGFDPSIRYYYQFLSLQKLCTDNQLYYEPFGWQYLSYYPNLFDYVFCLGILYHHKDPITILRLIHNSLKKNGTIIVECQGIAGEQEIALFPQKTYAKVKGTYFLPTAKCLKNWLQRAYFKNIEVFYTHKMTSNEQRKTKWMTKESFADFIDENKQKTIEGYPLPIRIFIKAKK